jgi:hypothetical protein
VTPPEGDLIHAVGAVLGAGRKAEKSLQELIGEAEVRGRRAVVSWRDAVLHGDPELVGRISRVAGGTPGTPVEFLRALRSVGGHMRAAGAAVSAQGASVSLSGSRSGSPLLDA